jgi:hypothetical protein
VSTWLFILLLWIAPALALLVLLIRTAIRRTGRERAGKATDSTER